MRVLILSSSTGAGHDSCAKAIKEAFDKHGDKCEIAEVLNFISKSVAVVVTNSHTLIYRYFPSAFKMGYKYMENHSSSYAKGTIVNKILSSGGKKLYDYIVKGQYDAVICSHPFATITLAAALEGKQHNIKTGFVATDYTCAPTIDAKALDAYFIPDDRLTEKFIQYGIDKEKIFPSGIPVRSFFYNHTEKVLAKKSVGINPKNLHLLVMCGSMGCGPIKKIVLNISKKISENVEITIICGRNKGLKRKLLKRHRNQSNIHILGYTREVPLLLDSADLYLTKPGGLSVSEASAKKVPMVFINAVAGCEEYNLKHFVNLGDAICENNVKVLSSLCSELLKSKETIEKMKSAMETKLDTSAAEYIRNYFVNKFQGEILC